MAPRAPGQGLSRREVLGGALGAALLACRPRIPLYVPAYRTAHPPGGSYAPGLATSSPAAAQFAGLRGFCDGVPAVGASELAIRRDQARGQLKAFGLQALVVEAGEALVYFTGVRWGRSERPLLWLLPAEGAPTFIGPSFEESTLREQIGGAGLRLWHEHERAYALVGEALAEAGATKARVGVEPTTRMFVVEGLRRDVPEASFVDGGAPVRNCRMIKSAAELALLRRANEATKAALRAASEHTRDGMLEAELVALVRGAQEAAGLTDTWALALFGQNAAFPHGTRGSLRLADGDLVLVDAGGSLHGYRSDITRTWPFGHITEEGRKVYEAVLQAQTAALAVIKPGQTCGAADAAARAVITAAGFGPDDAFFTHRLGHGIGLETHEDPYLVRDSPLVLTAGMTMSNEPGIYVKGKLGVRIEDIVAVTRDGHEVFGPRATSLEEPFGPLK